MIHHILKGDKQQHYGINVNADKTHVLLQLGDKMDQIRVKLTPEEVDQIIANLKIRKEEILK